MKSIILRSALISLDMDHSSTLALLPCVPLTLRSPSPLDTPVCSLTLGLGHAPMTVNARCSDMLPPDVDLINSNVHPLFIQKGLTDGAALHCVDAVSH